MDAQLQDLLDKKAIEEVLLRYCRTLDWLDEDGLATVFWPDAAVDYGFFKGSGAEFIPAVMQVELASPRRWHLGVNAMIKLNGRDKADVESYGIASATTETEDGPVASLIGGRYLDAFEKRDGEWRISSRTYILDWAQRFPDICQQMIDGGFTLNRLDIQKAGHPDYRPM